MLLGVEAEVERILFFGFVVLGVLLDQGDHVDEVRVVSVDVAEFDLDEVLDHLLSLAQGLGQ